jgi:MFS family permease
MAHADDAAAVPLLASPTKAAGDKRPRRNMYAFACATLASMTTILMGYSTCHPPLICHISSPRMDVHASPCSICPLADLALMSGAQLFIREDLGLSDAQMEVLACSINVFMLVSILAAGWAADVLGRRGTLVLANISLMAGALAMALGGSFPALMLARGVTSVGYGFSIIVTSVYNAEISPPSMRGFLSSFLDVCMCQQWTSSSSC